MDILLALVSIAGPCIFLLWLSLKTTRLVSLHLFSVMIFFVVLPLMASISELGRRGGSLSGARLFDAVVQNEWLFILYGCGLLFVAVLFRDRILEQRIAWAMARQNLDTRWFLVLIGTAAADLAIRLQYGLLVSGSEVEIGDMPYAVTSLHSIIVALEFGLFCYFATFIGKTKAPLMLWGIGAFHCVFMLLVSGRRMLILSLIVLAITRAATITIRPTRRMLIAGALVLGLFVIITPFFGTARENVLSQTASGVSTVEAAFGGIAQAVNEAGSSTNTFWGDTQDNIAIRGNAGTFFYSVAKSLPHTLNGAVVGTSLSWGIPSFIVAKPQLQSEAMIQIASGMLVYDDAVSIPLTFYADFGAAGMVMAGVYMGLALYALSSILAQPRQYTLFTVLALGAYFQLSFMIEGEMYNHIALYRNLLLMWLFTLSLGKHPVALSEIPKAGMQLSPPAHQ